MFKGKIDLIDEKENKDKNKENDDKKEKGVEKEKKEVKKENEDKKKKEDKKEEKKEENKIEIEKRKDKLSILLKTLGELFIEFFWFIHEIMKLALKENESENDKGKIVCISLSNKNYILRDSDYKDEEETVLKLVVGHTVIYGLNKKYAKRLKVETTRALYFLLSESKEIFAFDEHIPLKIK